MKKYKVHDWQFMSYDEKFTLVMQQQNLKCSHNRGIQIPEIAGNPLVWRVTMSDNIRFCM